MIFPDNGIKGIPNSSFLYNGESPQIATHLFYFKEEDARDDGWTEQSINWEDDGNAVNFTLNQTKADGDKQFKAGVAILPRVEIDRIRQRPTHADVLSYERQALPENPYHGNILLRTGKVKPPIMRQIAATLALYATYVPAPDSKS
jgi:hypothetical protein